MIFAVPKEQAKSQYPTVARSECVRAGLCNTD